MITEDDELNVVRRWHGDVSDLRAEHKSVVLIRDNAAKYKSGKIMKFLDSKGVTCHFSTPNEQWQNGTAESTINSIMLVSRIVMVEPGPGGQSGSGPQQQARMPAM